MAPRGFAPGPIRPYLSELRPGEIMPLYLGIMVLQVALMVHVARTGRPWYWFAILFFLPLAGAAAYVLVELVPGWIRGTPGRAVRKRATALVDPNRDYRQLVLRNELVGSIDDRRGLADELARRGRAEEAVAIVEASLTGLYQDDATLLIQLARLQAANNDAASALATIERLRAAHPDLRSHEALAIESRALEACGRLDEARAAYEALVLVAPGQEWRARLAMLLERLGRTADAARAWRDIAGAYELAPSHVRRAERAWFDLARGRVRSVS
ncbi:MAG: rane protein [Rhodospirillales bacterium]|nr:rane protein [Rhodospirillales bacterium]